jgi:UDP-2-acetamido-3-amino-2,3-dideoxy-glucuronate N-acetyltransferase
MKNLAVIGAGYWGKNLVRNFSELGVLKYICDMNADIKKDMAARYPDAQVLSRLGDILRDKEIGAVAIATPAETHFEIAREILEAGRHVFVEKPLCLKVEEAEALIKLARAQQKQLMVGHVLHYHPAIIQMKELINAGEIGKVDYFYSNRLNLGKFRSEENILWSFAPHDISLMLSLVKQYPNIVHCTGGNYISSSIADVTLCNFSFLSGVRGHIFVSWLHPTKEQKVVVVGNQGMLVFDDGAEPDEKLMLYRHKVLWKNGQPVPDKSEGQFVKLDWIEPLRNECQAFLRACENNVPTMTDGAEGLQTLRLLNDCQQSLSNGKPIEYRPVGLGGVTTPDNISVHPSSIVDANARIGKGSKIWHFCHVSEGAKLGENCSLGQNVFIGRNVLIGSNVKIQNNVSIYERVEVEDHVFLGPSMVFTNVMNPRSEVSRKSEYRRTLIKRGATIGANATIVCGHTIGSYAFVGAGSTVTRDVPDFALVHGVPARIQAWMCRCGEKLPVNHKGSLQCSHCKAQYQVTADKNMPKGLRITVVESPSSSRSKASKSDRRLSV